ncbi:MAG: hypothetical protein WDW36_005259 [Sanguina aurantia]
MLIKAATQQIDQLKASVLAAQQPRALPSPAAVKAPASNSTKLPNPPATTPLHPQAIAHLHGVVLIAAERLRAVSHLFDRCRSSRHQQLALRKARQRPSTAAATSITNGLAQLVSTGQAVSGLERSMAEVSTLFQVFSSAVHSQAEAIEHIYDAACEATHFVAAGNESLVKTIAVSRSVQASAAAERPVWFPGNEAPAHLDGTLAGDYGFDPLSLGSEKELLRWFVQAELVHARWAMLGVAGILFTAVGAEAGNGLPQWYDAGKVSIESSGIPFGTLLVTQALLFGWVEFKRWFDFQVPGSQGDGSFLGLTDELKGTTNGYPGGKLFDPIGLSRGSEAQLKEYKTKEIKNGRLAMVAMVGFLAQHSATGKGPIQNLTDHLADPYHVLFTTNGTSLPFLN